MSTRNPLTCTDFRSRGPVFFERLSYPIKVLTNTLKILLLFCSLHAMGSNELSTNTSNSASTNSTPENQPAYKVQNCTPTNNYLEPALEELKNQSLTSNNINFLQQVLGDQVNGVMSGQNRNPSPVGDDFGKNFWNLLYDIHETVTYWSQISPYYEKERLPPLINPRCVAEALRQGSGISHFQCGQKNPPKKPCASANYIQLVTNSFSSVAQCMASIGYPFGDPKKMPSNEFGTPTLTEEQKKTSKWFSIWSIMNRAFISMPSVQQKQEALGN